MKTHFLFLQMIETSAFNLFFFTPFAISTRKVQCHYSTQASLFFLVVFLVSKSVQFMKSLSLIDDFRSHRSFVLVEPSEVGRLSVVNKYATPQENRAPLFVLMTDEFSNS